MTGRIRFRVEPGDVPLEQAARRLGKDMAEFVAILPKLIARGFPKPDPDTGNFDLAAIDAWRRMRNPHLFGAPAGGGMGARDAGQVAQDRIAELRKKAGVT